MRLLVVEEAKDWRWNSFRRYAFREMSVVETESEWTATDRELQASSVAPRIFLLPGYRPNAGPEPGHDDGGSGRCWARSCSYHYRWDRWIVVQSAAAAVYKLAGISSSAAQVGHKWGYFGLPSCERRTTESAPTQELFHGVMDGRDGCTMVPLSRLRRKSRSIIFVQEERHCEIHTDRNASVSVICWFFSSTTRTAVKSQR